MKNTPSELSFLPEEVLDVLSRLSASQSSPEPVEPTSESTKESTRESTKELTKDSTREFTKEFTREVTKEFTKEITREFTKELSKESTKEFTKEFIREFTRESTVIFDKNGSPPANRLAEEMPISPVSVNPNQQEQDEETDTTPVNKKQVERLRRAIAKGEYEINAANIALGILAAERKLRELKKE